MQTSEAGFEMYYLIEMLLELAPSYIVGSGLGLICVMSYLILSVISAWLTIVVCYSSLILAVPMRKC